MARARPGFIDVRRLLISVIVASFISSVIFFVLNDFGITWDEPIHMRNADAYVAWLKRPIFSDKDKFFAATVDDVHPPFRKLVGGLTHEFLTDTLKVIDNTRGYRISSLLFVFPFIILFTYVAIGQFGYAVGILVPLMFSFLPHVLFLTPLLTMDYAISALWFVAVIAAMKGLKNNFWLLMSALCVGLTMLTKLHGFLLFIPIGGYFIWKKKLTRFIVVVVVAFTVYIAGWPWLWTNLPAHLGEYFRIQTAHGSVPEYIFGTTYRFAPWWYPMVMVLTTTPALILILFFAGAYRAIRNGTLWDRVILANALFPIAFFSLPGVYRYDWVRLFLPAYPFIILIAGKGIAGVHKALRVVVLFLWIITLFYSVIRIHPWESAYYNELVGGVRGAKQIGMESEFWGNSYLGVLPWMNLHKDHMMCVTPTTYPFYYYQAMGQIQPGVVFTAGRNACDYVIVLMRQGLFILDPYIEKVVRTQKPIYSVSVDAVPLVAVYDIRTVKE
jgi:hypothetical protein